MFFIMCVRLQEHMDAVHADWRKYLNLLICEENHLKHMGEYHKVNNVKRETKIHANGTQTHQKSYHWMTHLNSTPVFTAQCWHVQFQTEAGDMQDLLKRLDTEINQKYNSDFKDQHQLDGLLTNLNVHIYSFNSSSIYLLLKEYSWHVVIICVVFYCCLSIWTECMTSYCCSVFTH